MKILQIISGQDVNGALVYCKLLCERLVNRGLEVHLLTRPGSWIVSQLSPEVRVIESSLKRFPGTEPRRIASYIRAHNIDIVHTHMSSAHNFGVAMKWMTGVRLVATAHATYIQAHWPFNDLVLANSAATAEFYRHYRLVSPRRLKTIFCFADVQKFLSTADFHRQWFRGELGARDNRWLMCTVGEVVPRKGHEFLFSAMPEIIRAIPDAELALLGRFHRRERYTARLRTLQIRENLFRRVHWLGRRNNINEYLKAMDVCIVPSVQESLGLVAVEAQAAGIPVVATNVGGLPEVVDNGISGLTVPPADPRSLAQAVVRLHRDADLRSRLVANGLESAARKFCPERLTDAIVDSYRELLANR